MAPFATFPFSVIRRKGRFSLGGAILTSKVALPAFLLRPPASELGLPASELGPPAYLLKPRASEAQHPPYLFARFDQYAASLTFLLGPPAYLLRPWAYLLGRRTSKAKRASSTRDSVAF